MEIRDSLRMLRSEVGMTQMEFAAAVYVSFSTVNRWENRGMRPNRMQSKAILDLAKQNHVSTACLAMLSQCLLASRADDKAERERQKRASEQIKLEQRDLLTAEQFRKTMDNIDMALVGQRFYDRDPSSCDVFYCNSYLAKSFGYPPAEFGEKLRREPFFAIAPEDHKELEKQFRALLSHRMECSEFSPVVRAMRKDGSSFWLEVKAASLTEYSYGQELFTSCRDVTRRVEAEQRYREEVLLRDVSMQVMFSNVHCDLTEDRVSRRYNLEAVLGRDYDDGPLDPLVRALADAAPDGEDKQRFLERFSRAGLLAAYERGEVYGNAVLFNRNARRWLRNEYLVVKNPVSGNIHALIYVFDMQRQILSETMLGIFLKNFFDFVGLIDAGAGTVEPYYYAENVFHERRSGARRYSELCEEKLRQYGCRETAEAERDAVSLETIRAKLETADFYTTVLHLRGYGDEPLQKKVTYTYLDGSRGTIIVAQSDLGELTRFMQRHKGQYTGGGNA